MPEPPADVLARQAARLKKQLEEIQRQQAQLATDPALITKTAAAHPVHGPAVVQSIYEATGKNGPATAAIVGMAVSEMHTFRKQATPKDLDQEK